MRLLVGKVKKSELHLKPTKPRAWPSSDTEISILTMGALEIAVYVKDQLRAQNVQLRQAVDFNGGVQRLIDMPDAVDHRKHPEIDEIRVQLPSCTLYTSAQDFQHLQGHELEKAPVYVNFEDHMFLGIVDKYTHVGIGTLWQQVDAIPAGGRRLEHAWLHRQLRLGIASFSKKVLRHHNVRGVTSSTYVQIHVPPCAGVGSGEDPSQGEGGGESKSSQGGRGGQGTSKRKGKGKGKRSVESHEPIVQYWQPACYTVLWPVIFACAHDEQLACTCCASFQSPLYVRSRSLTYEDHVCAD